MFQSVRLFPQWLSGDNYIRSSLVKFCRSRSIARRIFFSLRNCVRQCLGAYQKLPYFLLFSLFSFHLPGRPLIIYADLYIVDIGEISVTNMVSCYESLDIN